MGLKMNWKQSGLYILLISLFLFFGVAIWLIHLGTYLPRKVILIDA